MTVTLLVNGVPTQVTGRIYSSPGARDPPLPEDGMRRLTVVESTILPLIHLQTLIDDNAPDAQDAQAALEEATAILVEQGMLDVLITIAARQMTE